MSEAAAATTTTPRKKSAPAESEEQGDDDDEASAGASGGGRKEETTPKMKGSGGGGGRYFDEDEEGSDDEAGGGDDERDDDAKAGVDVDDDENVVNDEDNGGGGSGDDNVEDEEREAVAVSVKGARKEETDNGSSDDENDGGDDDDDGDDDEGSSTASSSSSYETGSSYDTGDESDYSDYTDDDDDTSFDPRGVAAEEMPVLKYARILGDLPRVAPPPTAEEERAARAAAVRKATLGATAVENEDQAGPDAAAGGDRPDSAAAGRASVAEGAAGGGGRPSSAGKILAHPVTSSSMGRVVLVPGPGGPSGFGGSPDGAAAAASSQSPSVTIRHYHVLALGFADGTVKLMDPRTTAPVAPRDALSVAPPPAAVAAAEGGFMSLSRHGGSRHGPPSSSQRGGRYVGVGKSMGGSLHGLPGSKMAPGSGMPSATGEEVAAVVGLSFDSSSTFLGAVDTDGNVAVFELKYCHSSPSSSGPAMVTRSKTASMPDRTPAPAAAAGAAAAPPAEENNPLASLWSQWSGAAAKPATAATPTLPPSRAISAPTPDEPPPSAAAPATAHAPHGSLSVALPIPVARTSYSRSTHSSPTCLALDPSYKRRREKMVAVGFADGRVVLTRMRRLFGGQRDDVLYQGVPRPRWGMGGGGEEGGTAKGGIEALEWRGGLLAWADSSGVKLYDVDAMSNIAKIDRPRGARPALWPTVSSLRPTLRFERSDSLLIAWGDCIMTMSVREKVVRPRGGGEDKGGAEASQQQQQHAVKRRIVECGMAWELDCVACGAVPLDSEHVAVLGLVAARRGDGEEDDENYGGDALGGDAAEEEEDPPPPPEGTTAGGGNFLELQIISRTAGTVTSSDALPLLSVRRSPDDVGAAAIAGGVGALPAHLRGARPPRRRRLWVPDSADAYSLTSTYCTPRMDDRAEKEEEENSGESAEGLGNFEMDIFDALAGAGEALDGGGAAAKNAQFQDPHTKWTMRSVTCTDDDDEEVDEPDCGGGTVEEKKEKKDSGVSSSVRSDDSDDYSFLFRPRKVTPASAADRRTAVAAAIPPPSDPPIMAVTSPHDAVLVRTRDADDAVSHARSAGRHGLALRRALRHRRMVRRHNLNRLIDEYLTALLRLDGGDRGAAALYAASSSSSSRRGGRGRRVNRSSMVRRLLLAARATPILFGAHVDMWKRWSREFATIPGALFVLREHLPVRDPRLPASLYEMVLYKMFSDVQEMTRESKDDGQHQRRGGIAAAIASPRDAKELFLNALRAWGPISSLRERIKLQRIYGKNDVWRGGQIFSNSALDRAETDLYARMHQSAAGYLDAESAVPKLGGSSAAVMRRKKLDSANVLNQPAGVTYDSLFNIRNVALRLHSLVAVATPEDDSDEPSGESSDANDIALEGMAELEFMMGHYAESLSLLLTIGAHDADADLTRLEEDALAYVYGATPRRRACDAKNTHRSHHVLAMIESHHAHGCLLDETFLSHSDSSGAAATKLSLREDDGSDWRGRSPILALILLVGLDLSGHFLVEHTVLPRAARSSQHHPPVDLGAVLPINMVANQLRSRPVLLHWYLHQIFVNKPEVYVKFPNTAVPPRSITDLHRSHLELHIKYAEDTVDKDRSLADIPAYDEEEAETPLMSFLKAALPHGGTRPDDVRRMLEVCREGSRDLATPDKTRPIGSVMHPQLFAKELAYVIERCGSGTEDDARIVLLLYLEGAKSLSLAVAYVQRNTSHSGVLWELLVSYCIQPKPTLSGATRSSRDSPHPEDGSLFGSLLEVSARSGADLAKLILKIPKGMRIEGLRPKLVAAVADYRLKEKIHKSSAEILLKDKVSLLRELSHRSRRGLRVVAPSQVGKGARLQRGLTALQAGGIPQESTRDELSELPDLKRPGRQKLNVMPIEMMGSIRLPDYP